MKLPALLLASIASLSACSTAADRVRTAAATGSQAAEADLTQENGPSAVPREGWVETVSGWYPSREACLQRRGHEAVGTPLSLDEECLAPGKPAPNPQG